MSKTKLTPEEKKAKTKEYNKAYYEANAERLRLHKKAYARVYREKNPESTKVSRDKWLRENPDKVKCIAKRSRDKHRKTLNAAISAWKKRNPDKVRSYNMRRKAIMLNAIPLWADFDKIEEIYELAVKMSNESDAMYHVDHIVPLKSDLVCGLHWEGNLQILTQKDNLRKGNYWWPDMP